MLPLALPAAATPRAAPVAPIAAAVGPAAAARACAALEHDAIHRRTFAELAGFVHWLQVNHARGFVGEVGWPDLSSNDGPQWDCLARDYLRRLSRLRLPAAVWEASERPFPTTPLAAFHGPYYGGPISQADSQAADMTQALGPGYPLAVSVSGGEDGFGDVGASAFTSSTPEAVTATAEPYPTAASFAYLAAQGVRLVRLPFRWERLQPVPGAALDAPALADLVGAVRRARAAGLTVLLDLHNYAGFYVSDPSTRAATRESLGSAALPLARLADVWRRVAAVFRSVPGVEYGLMNEPVGVLGGRGQSPATAWEQAAQLAVSAIRSTGDRHPVLVSGPDWDGMQSFPRLFPRAWVRDPVHAVVYEVHHYWDLGHQSTYSVSYAQEDADLGG